MSHSEQLNELAKALASAQAEFGAVPKDASNPFFHSSYASLAQVVKTASPVISKNGLSVTQFLGHDGEGDTLTTWLLHSSGQWINDTMRLRPVKNDPQAHGSATSYAKRYAYMAVLGLVADEDDDGNKASAKSPAQTVNLDALKSAAKRAGASKDVVAELALNNFSRGLGNLNQAEVDQMTTYFTELAVKAELGAK